MSTNIQVLPGKVGISNTSPTHTLDIGSNVYVDDTAENTLTVTGKIYTTEMDVTSNLEVGTANLFVDTTTGRVGLGTSQPAYALDVHGTANVGALTATTGVISGDLEVDTDTLFVDAASDRVGINTSSPSVDLDVVGEMKVSGSVAVDTDTLFVDAVSGNVGIGTTSPASKLHVDNGVLVVRDTPETNTKLLFPDGDGGGTFTNEHLIGNTHISVAQFVSEQGDDASTIAIINKDRGNNTTKNASIGFFNTDTVGTGKYGGRIGFWSEDSNATKQQFRIYTSGTSAGYDLPVQRMVVTGDGNVGIGTDSPNAHLHISGGTGDAHLILEADTDNSNEADNPKIIFRQDGGYYTGEIGTDNNRMVFRSKSTTTTNTGFVFYSNVAPGETSKTDIDDLEDTQVEVMRITGDGNVGIGKASPAYKLDVVGDIRIRGGLLISSVGNQANPIMDLRELYGKSAGNYYVRFFDGTISQHYWDGLWLKIHEEGLNADQYTSYWSHSTTREMTNFGDLGSGYGHGWDLDTGADSYLTLNNLPPHSHTRYSVKWHFVDSIDREDNYLEVYDFRSYDSLERMWFGNRNISDAGMNVRTLYHSTSGAFTTATYSYEPWSGGTSTSTFGYETIDTGPMPHSTPRFKVRHYTATDQPTSDEAVYYTHSTIWIK